MKHNIWPCAGVVGCVSAASKVISMAPGLPRRVCVRFCVLRLKFRIQPDRPNNRPFWPQTSAQQISADCENLCGPQQIKEKGACCNRTRQGISEKKAQLEFQVQDRKLIMCIHLWNTQNQLQVDEKARVVIKCKFKARRFSSPHALGTNFGFYEP